MSRAECNVRVEFSVRVLSLTETECRALDALVGYGDNAFLDVFEKHLGAHYMRDHESGLRDFFATVRTQVLPGLAQIDRLRKSIAETKPTPAPAAEKAGVDDRE